MKRCLQVENHQTACGIHMYRVSHTTTTREVRCTACRSSQAFRLKQEQERRLWQEPVE